MYANENVVLDAIYVKHRIAAGDRARFVQDFYGGQWVELQHRLFFWEKQRVRLTAQDMQQVRDFVSARRNGAKSQAVAAG